MTTPTTLTDRYISAVVRRLPEARRASVADELRDSLAADIAARQAAGAEPADAEREALIALGDPDRVAAHHGGAPLHLIGPEVYLDWRRLLTVLLSTVLPVIAAALVLAQVLAGANALDIVTGVIGTVLSVGIAMAFWVTVVFAVIERTGAGDRPLVRWTPDSLPAATNRPQVGVDVLIGGILGVVLLAAGLVAQQLLPAFRDADGAAVPFLDPGLWVFWIPYFIVVLLAELVFAIVLYRRRSWNTALAAINAVLNLAVAVPLIALLAADAVVNPVFSERLAAVLADDPEALIAIGRSGVVVAVAAGLIALLDTIDGVRKAVQAQRSAL